MATPVSPTQNVLQCVQATQYPQTMPKKAPQKIPLISVRPMANGEAPAIRALLCRELLETDPTEVDRDSMVDLSRIDAALACHGPEMNWTIAEMAGEIVGAAMVAMSIAADDVWELANLAVSKRHQGHGIGTVLLQACESHAASLGAKVILLATGTPGFYRSLGYRAIRGMAGLMLKRLG